MSYFFVILFFILTGNLIGCTETHNKNIKIHPINSKIHNALLLSAAGDALGRITEFEIINPGKPLIKKGFSDIKPVEHPAKGLVYAYTDDTLMALQVLNAALFSEKNNENFRLRLADNFNTTFIHPEHDSFYTLRAHGITNIKKLKKSLSTIKQMSHDFSDNVEIAKEGGCGSVMRAWTLGLIHWKPEDHALLIERADAQSCLTHRHPMARAASVASAVGIVEALQNKKIEDIVREMIHAAQQYELEERNYNKKLLLNKNFSEAEASGDNVAQNQLTTAQMISYAYNAALKGKKPEEILGTNNDKQINHRSPNGFLLGWAADEAIAAAVYVFVRHKNDPKGALIEAINTPGDSDSIAALAGALVGAYQKGNVDLSFIPKNLEDYKILGHDLPSKITQKTNV